MKKMKRMKKMIALALTIALVLSLLAGCAKKEEAKLNIGVINGPTGVGAVNIMDKADSGVYPNYNFSISPEAAEMAAKLTNGELDIAALPTNLAANLYNKTNHEIRIIAINCLGVLYILENGNTVSSVKDLEGRTIYACSQGANPEYIMNYVLRGNGLEPGEDVDIIFKDTTEVVSLMVSGQADICMLPVPAATTVTVKNPDVRFALDLTAEYNNVAGDGSTVTMGCLVTTEKFAREHKSDIELFLERYEKSIGELLSDVDAAAELVAKYGITANAAIAKKAIPACSIVCKTGKDMKVLLDGYYKVLFDASPASIGGSIPDEEFYYEK